jgi:hypothetical protein
MQRQQAKLNLICTFSGKNKQTSIKTREFDRSLFVISDLPYAAERGWRIALYSMQVSL